ncbi:MAG: peptide-methionine (R)-S-oxide reductase [Chlamydiae bacterium CG10_big_fil_rev_8_21_14_0_10_35_9]|nr:MAG: peptide-methionine (R)-S-oxide reductase [Chlamydiae bacterium CG10_big_fil_rev_8_21_14_0_10_35_9]
MGKKELTDDEWKKKLSADQYKVCRQKGTEPPFANEYYNHKEKGTYHCVCCGQPLFSSDNKYDSKTGWPSFTKPIHQSAVTEEPDYTLESIRTEVKCSNCNSHLGHVFPDGPKPTGLRYCINSTSLQFKKS